MYGQYGKPVYYRVRKSWEDKSSQLGAYHNLQYAKDCVNAHPGYAAFDEAGNQVYPEARQQEIDEAGNQLYPEARQQEIPFRVKVNIDTLPIYTGPGTHYPKTGKNTGKGIFTIVEIAGDDDKDWGLLKAYANKRNGWIELDKTVKV